MIKPLPALPCPAGRVRMLKEGGMGAVKLEGGSPARVEAARAIVESGVAVMGHVGLTPQSVRVSVSECSSCAVGVICWLGDPQAASGLLQVVRSA